jgi:hypothetical protein
MSTGVVAHALELDPKAMRAMIEIGTLPAPRWINLGRRRERVYSLEWLLLASEQLNARRLPGLESEPRQDQFVQFVLRSWIRFWFLVIALSLEERPNRADRRLRHP